MQPDPLSAALNTVLARRVAVHLAWRYGGAALLGVVGLIAGGLVGHGFTGSVEPHVLATLVASCPSAGVVAGFTVGAYAAERHAQRRWHQWCMQAAQRYDSDAQDLMERLAHVVTAEGAWS